MCLKVSHRNKVNVNAFVQDSIRGITDMTKSHE